MEGLHIEATNENGYWHATTVTSWDVAAWRHCQSTDSSGCLHRLGFS